MSTEKYLTVKDIFNDIIRAGDLRMNNVGDRVCVIQVATGDVFCVSQSQWKAFLELSAQSCPTSSTQFFTAAKELLL